MKKDFKNNCRYNYYFNKSLKDGFALPTERLFVEKEKSNFFMKDGHYYFLIFCPR